MRPAPDTDSRESRVPQRNRSSVSARLLLLLCRLRRPSLQSPASLAHRFPTTPRRKHSRSRRLQRRLMRRAGCRVLAHSPPHHLSSTKERCSPIVFQHFSCLLPHLHSSLSENSIDVPPHPTHQSNPSPHPSLPPLHLLPLPPHPHLFHFSHLLPSNLPPTPPSFARARACLSPRTCNGFENNQGAEVVNRGGNFRVPLSVLHAGD